MRTLRYVSGRDVTPAERIEEIRRSLPPPEGRQSRLGYISKDDFAALIGCSRGRVIAWTREEDPDFPEERYRVRLAELSGGRYKPDDFRGPPQLGRESLRLARLERSVTDLTAALDDAKAVSVDLLGRVEALEKQAKKTARSQTRPLTAAPAKRRGQRTA